MPEGEEDELFSDYLSRTLDLPLPAIKPSRGFANCDEAWQTCDASEQLYESGDLDTSADGADMKPSSTGGVLGTHYDFVPERPAMPAPNSAYASATNVSNTGVVSGITITFICLPCHCY